MLTLRAIWSRTYRLGRNPRICRQNYLVKISNPPSSSAATLSSSSSTSLFNTLPMASSGGEGEGTGDDGNTLLMASNGGGGGGSGDDGNTLSMESNGGGCGGSGDDGNTLSMASNGGGGGSSDDDDYKVFKISSSSSLIIQRGDITKWSINGTSDAIVNAANERMLGGGGVDGAIHRAAGPALRDACYTVEKVRPGVRCPKGEARITPAFRLPVSNVIHTVGPIYDDDDHPEVILRNAYRNSLKLAKENNIEYIAFPAISCGVYGYPYDEAATIAISAVMESDGDFKEVHFVLFEDDVFDAWLKIASTTQTQLKESENPTTTKGEMPEEAGSQESNQQLHDYSTNISVTRGTINHENGASLENDASVETMDCIEEKSKQLAPLEEEQAVAELKRKREQTV